MITRNAINSAAREGLKYQKDPSVDKVVNDALEQEVDKKAKILSPHGVTLVPDNSRAGGTFNPKNEKVMISLRGSKLLDAVRKGSLNEIEDVVNTVRGAGTHEFDHAERSQQTEEQGHKDYADVLAALGIDPDFNIVYNYLDAMNNAYPSNKWKKLKYYNDPYEISAIAAQIGQAAANVARRRGERINKADINKWVTANWNDIVAVLGNDITDPARYLSGAVKIAVDETPHIEDKDKPKLLEKVHDDIGNIVYAMYERGGVNEKPSDEDIKQIHLHPIDDVQTYDRAYKPVPQLEEYGDFLTSSGSDPDAVTRSQRAKLEPKVEALLNDMNPSEGKYMDAKYSGDVARAISNMNGKEQGQIISILERMRDGRRTKI